MAGVVEKLKQHPEYPEIAELLRRYRIPLDQIFDFLGNAIFFKENHQVAGKKINALIRNNCSGSWDFCRVVY